MTRRSLEELAARGSGSVASPSCSRYDERVRRSTATSPPSRGWPTQWRATGATGSDSKVLTVGTLPVLNRWSGFQGVLLSVGVRCSRRKSPTAKVAAGLDLHAVGTAGSDRKAANASERHRQSKPSRQGPRFWRGPSRDGGVCTRQPLNTTGTI